MKPSIKATHYTGHNDQEQQCKLVMSCELLVWQKVHFHPASLTVIFLVIWLSQRDSAKSFRMSWRSLEIGGQHSDPETETKLVFIPLS
jgi:hypothetical protein